ncbi:hypothetical protein KY290_003384 [Solanum tuberosum]|uniref:Uncharacterized protein n=1 Tax=Solanum tuberosum TaxID=4113 RepID=A0ABQ7WSS3_SOLTU|nr:hypothetical protein KY284_003545 [Solanum tuberosum]KAH0732459.1 hypothetical protein KY289_003647 [Solanum tuberosum]KAH0767558.1 hypothetical protein KY285_003429 [Solanum tuberosum]KAH0783786.1 hypothetical protein KY290_003384 [Solanum tuberosum]
MTTALIKGVKKMNVIAIDRKKLKKGRLQVKAPIGVKEDWSSFQQFPYRNQVKL